MKVIDLLNSIANYGEYKQEFHFKYYDRNAEEYDISLLLCETLIHKLEIGQIDLNDEVEIIEEDKKIKEIDVLQKILSKDKIEALTKEVQDIEKKLNEIIKAINGLREDK